MSLIIFLMSELENSCQKIEQKYLHELFEKWNLEHLPVDEDFDDYLDNDGMKDTMEMKAYRISIWMTSLVNIKCSEKLLHNYVLFCQLSSQ